MTKRKWYDYLWVFSAIYLLLGFVNIVFAWLGMLCFAIPLIVSVTRGTKSYCNQYCGRGQLFDILGGKLKLSRNVKIPSFLYKKGFRYGFLVFFLTMFVNVVINTYFVFKETKTLGQVVTLFWTIRLPWHWAYVDGFVAPWIAQFSFGFYSLMLTSTLLGMILMLVFRPRSWCVICPMGTMTQLICKVKYKK